MKNDYLFDERKVLMSFSKDPSDVWTIDDALKGISIIGGTGSGKTSASGKTIALKFLKEGWGGVVLCAKTDEAMLWKEYCAETDRTNDLILFNEGSVHKDDIINFSGQEIVFNPIDYELKRDGRGKGDTQNLTNIFMNIYRMGNRIAQEGDTKEERFWDTSLKRCLNRVIDLLKLSKEDLTYSNMIKIINSSNDVNKNSVLAGIVKIEREEEEDDENNYCMKCILKAYKNHFVHSSQPTREQVNAFNLAGDYFTKSLPNLSDKTRGTIIEMFMGLAEPFMSGILFRHFSMATNILPEWTYTKKKIIILDFSIKNYLDAGIIAQCVFKLSFQQAIERRDTKVFPTPVFLWCDEAQYFVNPYDQIFLTTARSSRTSTVYLSQNISNYFAIMGSGNDAEARVNSLLGNLSTKIFHANSDAETNEYASKLFGSEMQSMSTASISRPHFSIEKTETESVTVHYLPQIQPKEFTILKSGGYQNNKKVQAYIMVTGRQWASGKNYVKVTFTQKFKEDI